MKPVTHKIHIPNKTASEKIMNLYLLIALLTLILMIIRVVGEVILFESTFFDIDDLWALILTADIDFLIFFLPATIILRFVERKLIKPIQSLSKIEGFIQKEKKIETEGLLEIYSPYLDEPDEIGTLARNYSNLIISNNHYIENINEIESERERIKAELDIAKKIQQSSLPTEEINNEYYDVFGFCKPAKEVGGDFYDYFEIDDENLAIVIGDASGKGVPAALLTTTTQTLIRELFNHEKDPSEILNRVNNHVCVNNSETMFITLWLGIYNKKTNILTFSNAGHNPPLIRKHDKFELMSINTGIVLGILEDFKFTTEEREFTNEIILYTDGITDAINKDDEAYGEKRLIDFLNRTKMENNIINNLIEDVNKFTQDTDQFDDMTMLILKKNN
jgi:sigma-B regulation protein RsbU (phosphoserine phosphatase)